MEEIEISGLDELQKALEELPKKVAKRGIRKALQVGGEVFKYAMYALAPKYTGFLSEHFGVKTRMERDELAGTAFVGPQGKVDYPLRGGGYKVRESKKGTKQIGRISVASVARFFEFGTSKLPKQPFMTQAFETKKDDAITVVAEVLREVIEDAS